MTNWIEYGKCYVTLGGDVTSPLARTPVLSTNGDKFKFCGKIEYDERLLFWNEDGTSSIGDGSIYTLMDEAEIQVERKSDENIDLEKYNRDMSFLFDVKAEVVNARSKFSNVDLAHAMTEEFGEVIKALLDQKQKGKVSSREIYEECVQAAAMALRLATEGDPCFPGYIPPTECGDSK